MSKTQLAQLLQNCYVCGSLCDSVVRGVRGTMISTSSECSNGYSRNWESQRCHNEMPWANLLVAGAVVFSGSNVSKSLRFFRHLIVMIILPSVDYNPHMLWLPRYSHGIFTNRTFLLSIM